jgi:hypothetical protein
VAKVEQVAEGGIGEEAMNREADAILLLAVWLLLFLAGNLAFRKMNPQPCHDPYVECRDWHGNVESGSGGMR